MFYTQYILEHLNAYKCCTEIVSSHIFIFDSQEKNNYLQCKNNLHIVSNTIHKIIIHVF